MPMVKFPYTKDGEKKAKAAARQYGGRFVSDEKASKMKKGGTSVVIAVGSAKKPKPKPKPKKKKMAYGGMVAKKNKK